MFLFKPIYLLITQGLLQICFISLNGIDCTLFHIFYFQCHLSSLNMYEILSCNSWPYCAANMHIKCFSFCFSMFMRHRCQTVQDGMDNWIYVSPPTNKQRDGNSCGVFTLMVMFALQVIYL